MNNEHALTKPSRIKVVAVITAAVIVNLIILGGVALAVKSATAEPTRLDYLHLDNKRKVAQESLEAYRPMLQDYISHYNVAFKESFSSEDKAAIKDRYDSQFNDEMKLGEKRINSMSRSLALKNQSVKASYQQYSRDYKTMVEYVEMSKNTSGKVAEVITGSCKEVFNIKSYGDYAKKFVDQSQVCITKIGEAKQDVTPSAKVMLTSLQKMYKTKQDAFKKAVDEKDELGQIAAKSRALVGLLEVNSELAKILADYSSAESAENEKIDGKLARSSEALQKALEQAAGQAQAKGV